MEIVDIDALSTSLQTRLAQVSSQASHCIYKVPSQLRNVNKKAYEPEKVAIGPYHHGKDELKKMEEVKMRYMQSLLSRKPDVPAECYLSAIARVEKKARDCYEEPINLTPSEFIEVLVLDGCFIIELIGPGSKCHNDRIFPCLECDLILFENQIPFFVLCELFDLIEGPDQHAVLMERVLDFCNNVFPGNIMYKPGRRSEEIKHILDLIYRSWYPPLSDDIETATQAYLSDLIIPTATQLEDAHVKFEKEEYNTVHEGFHESKVTTIFDVEFKEDGVMLMPTLVIENGTESLLRNLIAFEQYLPTSEPNPGADYAQLLDCLINSSKDVQILSQHGVIENLLSSDQEVVDFVNRLTDKIIIYSDSFVFADTFERIKAHHKKRWNRAMAVYHRDYFNSPWAYVSFVAALVLLLLTITQTVFAALQQFS